MTTTLGLTSSRWWFKNETFPEEASLHELIDQKLGIYQAHSACNKQQSLDFLYLKKWFESSLVSK